MLSDRTPTPVPDEPPAGAAPFVQDVSVGMKWARSRRVERLIIAGWILVTAKSVAVWWACGHYAVPFHPLWIVGPTVAFAALCTGVYLFGRR